MSLFQRYRKLPVVVEAVQWNGRDGDITPAQLIAEGVLLKAEHRAEFGDTLLISTLEGPLSAQPGDYIIRGVQGEYYPVKPDIFAATYEREPEEAAPDAPEDATPVSEPEEVIVRKE